LSTITDRNDTDQDSTVIRRTDLTGMSFDDIANGAALPPLTPGEVLLEKFMRPAGLTARALAAELGIPGNRSPLSSTARAASPRRPRSCSGAGLGPAPSCG
jgi:hypothetical protein